MNTDKKMPDMEFTVDENADGVLPRAAVAVPRTQLADVAGRLRSKRKPVTVARMRVAVEQEVKRRHDRGRY